MLRNLFDIPSIGTSAPPEFPMVRAGETKGAFPEDPAELVVFVHGWLDLVTGEAPAQANAVKRAVDAAGHDADVVGFAYPSNLPLWRSNRAIARRKGRELADWLVAYRADRPGLPVRLVAHSLGALPALSCLDELRERGEAVRSCSLMGAGVDCDTVVEGGTWYAAVRDGAERVHSYHLDWEITLDLLYRSAEFGDRALGVRGACGTPPENYRDHDVSDEVQNHFTYLKREGGCLDRVVADFAE